MSVAGISSTGAITGTSVNISDGTVTCGIVNSKYVVQTFPITIIGGGGSTNLFLGTFIVPTSIGYVVNVKVYSHMGFNARNDQDYSVDINFKISNGFNFNGSGFNGNSYHLVYDNAFNYNLAGYGSNFIYWVGDAAGSNARSYSLYMYHGSYNDNSFYTVTYSNACSWSTTTQNASPGSPSNTSTCLLSTSITPLSSQSVNADVKFKTVVVSNNSYYYKIGGTMGVSENGMWMNMANDTNGVIQGEYQGIRYNNICLNPYGASVGIGKLNPAYTLDVNGTLNAGAIIGTNSITLNFAGSTQPTLNINANGGGGVGKAIINLQPWIGRGTDSCRIEAVDASNFSTNLGFFTAAGGSTTTTPQNRMTITSNGNVGIGTTTPGYLLDVNGTLNAGVITGSSVNVGTAAGNTITGGSLVISSGASLSGITNAGAITGTSVNVGTASGRTITAGNLVISSGASLSGITNAGAITGTSLSVGTAAGNTVTAGNLIVGASSGITNAGAITGISLSVGTTSGRTITGGSLQIGSSSSITNAGAITGTGLDINSTYRYLFADMPTGSNGISFYMANDTTGVITSLKAGQYYNKILINPSSDAGSVGIGVPIGSTPAAKLEVNGSLKAGDITGTSLAISGSGTITTPTTSDSSTTIATTAYVKNQGYSKVSVANANYNLSGGGTVTWNAGTRTVSWSQRVIAINLNSSLAYSGFFDIGPTSFTFTNGWTALYYVPTNGMGPAFVDNKLVQASFPQEIGENWIFICSFHADNLSLRWNPGYITIPNGGTYTSDTGICSWQFQPGVYITDSNNNTKGPPLLTSINNMSLFYSNAYYYYVMPKYKLEFYNNSTLLASLNNTTNVMKQFTYNSDIASVNRLKLYYNNVELVPSIYSNTNWTLLTYASPTKILYNIYCDSTGQTYVAANSNDTTGTSNYIYYSVNAGQTWTNIQVPVFTSGNKDKPNIFFAKCTLNKIYVLLGYIGSGFDSYLYIYNITTTTWDITRTYRAANTINQFPGLDISTDGTKITFIWNSTGSGQSYVLLSTNSGDTFNVVLNKETSNPNYNALSISGNGNYIYACFGNRVSDIGLYIYNISTNTSTKISTNQYSYLSSNYNGSVCIANYGGANYDLYVNYGASFVTYTLAGYSFFKFNNTTNTVVAAGTNVPIKYNTNYGNDNVWNNYGSSETYTVTNYNSFYSTDNQVILINYTTDQIYKIVT